MPTGSPALDILQNILVFIKSWKAWSVKLSQNDHYSLVNFQEECVTYYSPPPHTIDFSPLFVDLRATHEMEERYGNQCSHITTFTINGQFITHA